LKQEEKRKYPNICFSFPPRVGIRKYPWNTTLFFYKIRFNRFLVNCKINSIFLSDINLLYYL
jgi:hypothetical protein